MGEALAWSSPLSLFLEELACILWDFKVCSRGSLASSKSLECFEGGGEGAGVGQSSKGNVGHRLVGEPLLEQIILLKRCFNCG